MPQGRIILNSISESQRMAALKSDGARLLYTWLLTHVDINGCFSGDAQIVGNKVMTRINKRAKAIEGYLEDMETVHIRIKENTGEDVIPLIVRYKTKGDTFLWMPDFKEKQPYLNPAREAKSVISLPTPEQLQSKTLLSKVKQSKVKDKVKVKGNPATSFEYKEIEKFKGKLYDDDDLKIIETLYKLGYRLPREKEEEMSVWLDNLTKEFDDINIQNELTKFYDYWSENTRKLKTHKLGLRNWLTNSRRFRKLRT